MCDGVFNFFVILIEVLEDCEGIFFEVELGVIFGDYLFGFI